jgi:hypothetical protein
MLRSSSGCSGSGKTSIPSPRNVAQGFADHLNSVLNRTVSDARLTLVLARETPRPHFTLARFEHGRIASFGLLGSSLRLSVVQTVEIEGEKVHTVTYHYRLAASDAKDAWFLRWEYSRRRPRPDYDYPLSHVHVKAAFLDREAEALLVDSAASLHIPTARVALELVLWHLIAEWGIRAKTPDWQNILSDSLEGFHERRTAP